VKAIAVCGSPRIEGNTETLLGKVLDKLQAEGIETELIRLGEKKVNPCVACGGCGRLKNKQCVKKDDDFQEVFEKFLTADIIIVGSPVYFGSATPQMMSLLDRAGYVSRANGNLLSRKIGGPVVVARRAGQNFTYAQLMYWFMLNDMFVAGSTYWNIAFGLKKGDVLQDAEGISTAERFGENLAWLASKLNA
jgi:multimeric flavodoxin WrbA